MRARPDGALDEEDLDRLLRTYAGRVGVLAVTGASNVTGVVPPIHRLAAKVHAAGGRIVVDAAQLAAHRPIDMRPHDDPEHLDVVALSAHKMYAPFGSGALVGARDVFGAVPDHRGGGTVDAVTVDDVVVGRPPRSRGGRQPQRHRGGRPRRRGAAARRASGWTASPRRKPRCAGTPPSASPASPGCAKPVRAARTPIRSAWCSFTLDGVDHGLVAAVLGYEHAVGVRSGCFCAHPYLAHLVGMDPPTARAWARRVHDGDKRDAPGMVRISLGCYSDTADIDRAVDALERIAAGEVAGDYRCDEHGEYRPTGYVEPALFTVGGPA